MPRDHQRRHARGDKKGAPGDLQRGFGRLWAGWLACLPFTIRFRRLLLIGYKWVVMMARWRRGPRVRRIIMIRGFHISFCVVESNS
jgi:hypothetical protein